VKETKIVQTWRKVGLRDDDVVAADSDIINDATVATTTTANTDDDYKEDDDNVMDRAQDNWHCLGLDLLADTTMTLAEIEADKLYDNDSLSDLDMEDNNFNNNDNNIKYNNNININ
jgi:hypothetical protein